MTILYQIRRCLMPPEIECYQEIYHCLCVRLLDNRQSTKGIFISRGIHNIESPFCVGVCNMNETSHHIYF